MRNYYCLKFKISDGFYYKGVDTISGARSKEYYLKGSSEIEYFFINLDECYNRVITKCDTYQELKYNMERTVFMVLSRFNIENSDPSIIKDIYRFIESKEYREYTLQSYFN